MKKELAINVPSLDDVAEWAFNFIFLGDEWMKKGFAYNEFIQLVYNKEEGTVNFSNERFLFEEKAYYFGFYKIPFKKNQSCKDDFLWNLIKKQIDLENLALVYWDEPVIFKDGLKERPCLLYGYDEKDRQFSCLCQYQYGWKQLKINMDLFVKAIHKGKKGLNDDYSRISFYVKNHHFKGRMSGKKVVDRMSKYIQSIPGNQKGRLYGIDGIKAYLRDLRPRNEESMQYVMDSLNVILNHKRLMWDRLEFISHDGFLRKMDRYLNGYGEVKNQMDKALQTMKSYVNGEKGELDWSGEVERFVRLLDKERDVLSEALIYIGKKYKSYT